MNRWPTKPLAELGDLKGGGTPSRRIPEYFQGNIPWITGADVTDFYVREARGFITDQAVANSATNLLPAKTVLVVTRTGVGKIGVAAMPLCISQDLTGIVCNETVIPEYLAHCLRAGSSLLASAAQGSTIFGITREFLKRVRIPVPPLPEQERIVKLLDEADGLRKLRAHADRRMGDLVPALFHEFFSSPSPSRNGWPLIGLRETVKFVGGGTPSRARPEFFEGTIPWATSKDVKSEYLSDTQEHVTDEAVANSATNLVPAGSVLVVVKSKILLHSLPVAIITVPMCFGQDLKGLICGNKVVSEFIAAALRSQRDTILAQARGANTEGLTLEILREVKFPLPPLALQQEFASRVAEIRTMQADQAASRRRLDDLFQSMLHRAFNGDL
jgi:type I restriction enzyme S subunit